VIRCSGRFPFTLSLVDLFSISINGKEYRVDTADVDVNSKKGVGANRRTAEFGGGGAAIGALLGGIFGGGRGAEIGAAAGGGGGLLTQIFTHPRQTGPGSRGVFPHFPPGPHPGPPTSFQLIRRFGSLSLKLLTVARARQGFSLPEQL
jgi:hypothetical protein